MSKVRKLIDSIVLLWEAAIGEKKPPVRFADPFARSLFIGAVERMICVAYRRGVRAERARRKRSCSARYRRGHENS